MDAVTTTVSVRCSGKMHQISALPSGAFVFHNHTKTDRIAEDILVALGGQPCRCVQILQAWRNRNISGLPKGLIPAFYASKERRNKRNIYKTVGIDHLELSIMTRIAGRVHKLAHAAFEQCKYRRSVSRWAGGKHHINICFANEPEIHGYATKEWSSNSKYSGNNSHVSVRIPMLRWYHKVYKPGLAVIDGIFVLDATQTDDNEQIHVLAGRQSAGFSIQMCRATINIGNDGRKTLHWARNT